MIVKRGVHDAITTRSAGTVKVGGVGGVVDGPGIGVRALELVASGKTLAEANSGRVIIGIPIPEVIANLIKGGVRPLGALRPEVASVHDLVRSGVGVEQAAQLDSPRSLITNREDRQREKLPLQCQIPLPHITLSGVAVDEDAGCKVGSIAFRWIPCSTHKLKEIRKRRIQQGHPRKDWRIVLRAQQVTHIDEIIKDPTTTSQRHLPITENIPGETDAGSEVLRRRIMKEQRVSNPHDCIVGMIQVGETACHLGRIRVHLIA